ncbi:hypothetical protein BC938DRAFT_482531 [Jimgerdemannia flammicorona]|uniref:Uncharacterized protein n=1 Tax=Jimgerdemannia flammicorona TaxID=994334 RepID=A0A433QW83_9FUNG|nr:hypothetical protein BC938DRAFT_482531 [Jimgerdemannia flammicorona]
MANPADEYNTAAVFDADDSLLALIRNSLNLLYRRPVGVVLANRRYACNAEEGHNQSIPKINVDRLENDDYGNYWKNVVR